MSTELEPINSANELELSSLYEPIEVSDIQLPNVKLMAPLSEFVKAGKAKPQDVTLAFGNDDPAPRFLIGGPDKRESFVGFILDRDKTAARSELGSFEWQKERDYNDKFSQDVWFFYLAIPSFEPIIPVRAMLWKAAGAPCSRQLNTMIARANAAHNTDPIAVKFTVAGPKYSKGPQPYPYYYLVAEPTTDFTDEELELAKQQYIQMRRINEQYKKSDNFSPASYEDQPEL